MSLARKLGLLVALALAVSAVASSSAFATTVTPTGTYSGTENGAGSLASNSGTIITCTSSDAAANITEDGTGTITALSFASCQTQTGITCTVTVDTIAAGADISVDFASGASTWTTLATNTATITCLFGFVNCDVTVAQTLNGTVSNTVPGTYTIVNQATTIAGGGTCGTTGTWNSSWTITSPATGTIAA